MGLFQHKKNSLKNAQNDATDEEGRFLDDGFREELRTHGRRYFEKVISDNATLFKQDLDATLAKVNADLQQHVTDKLDSAVDEINDYLKEQVTKRIDDHFAQFETAMKDAQDAALGSLEESAKTLETQHKQLGTKLEEDIRDQRSLLHENFEENKARLLEMNDAQATATKWLNQAAESTQRQYQKLSSELEKNVAEQQRIMLESFEKNMSKIVEHYLLGALGDQYDFKAQLPSIIKQMEDNKQAIVDDMNL